MENEEENVIDSLLSTNIKAYTTKSQLTHIFKNFGMHSFHERIDNLGNKFYIFCPTTLTEYRGLCNFLVEEQVKFKTYQYNENKHVLIIPNRLILNFNPFAHCSFISPGNPEYYEYYLREPSKKANTLFKNGSPVYFDQFLKYREIQVAHYKYTINNMLKISPNIVAVKNIPEVDLISLLAIFNRHYFLKIEKPRNPCGFWKFYCGDNETYKSMLSEPYMLGIKPLYVTPFYGANLHLAHNNKRSKDTLHIYMKGEAFDPNFIKNKLEFPANTVWTLNGYENGYLYTYRFNSENELESAKFKNGIEFREFKGYTMTYADELNEQNILSNILRLVLPASEAFDPILKKQLGNLDYTMHKTGGTQVVEAFCKSFNEYMELYNSHVLYRGLFYRWAPINYGKYLRSIDTLKIYIQYNDSEADEEQVKSAFNGLNIKTSYWDYIYLNLVFDPSDIPAALFRIIKINNTKIHSYMLSKDRMTVKSSRLSFNGFRLVRANFNDQSIKILESNAYTINDHLYYVVKNSKALFEFKALFDNALKFGDHKNIAINFHNYEYDLKRYVYA